jgi:hypothetical protein
MEEEATKKPDSAAAKPLSEQDMLSRVGTAFPHTQNYTLGTLEQKRVTGLELYNRDQFPGDEQITGRSRYVTSDTFDNVEWTLANLMALFDGQEKVVQFSPTGPEDEALAEQQTDVVNFVVTQENNHALVLHDWLKNGLIGGLGIVTAEFYKDKRWKPAQVLEGVPNDLAVQYEESEQHEILEAGEPRAIPGMEMFPGMEMRDLKIREARVRSRVRIQVVPPEDFFVSKDAQFDYQTGGISADLQGFKRILPRAELTEMGYDAAKVARMAKGSPTNVKENLAPVLTAKVDEDVLTNMLKGSEKGGNRIAAARRQILQGQGNEAWDQFTAATVERMGNPKGEGFNGTQFLKGWNAMSPEAKSALFDGTTNEAYRADLDRLARIAANVKRYGKSANGSNTSNVQTIVGALGAIGVPVGGVLAGNTALVMSSLGSMATTGVASKVGDRLLTNPTVVSLVANLPRAQVQRGGVERTIAALHQYASSPSVDDATRAGIVALAEAISVRSDKKAK